MSQCARCSAILGCEDSRSSEMVGCGPLIPGCVASVSMPGNLPVVAVGAMNMAFFTVGGPGGGHRRALLGQRFDLGDRGAVDNGLQYLVLAQRVGDVVETAVALPLGAQLRRRHVARLRGRVDVLAELFVGDDE